MITTRDTRVIMSGMADYDTGAAYPTPQYVAGYQVDPRQGAGWAQYSGHGGQGQGSPSDRYSYYDNRSVLSIL